MTSENQDQFVHLNPVLAFALHDIWTVKWEKKESR